MRSLELKTLEIKDDFWIDWWFTKRWESLSKIFGSINDSRMFDFYTFM